MWAELPGWLVRGRFDLEGKEGTEAFAQEVVVLALEGAAFEGLDGVSF